MYRINILPEPEIFNGKKMYFWMVEGVSGETHYNCGHGWSASIEQAALDASQYYQSVIKNA